MTDGIGNLAPDLGHARKCGWVKWAMGSPPLDNWISNDNTERKKVTHYHNQRLPGACNRSPGSKLLSITTQLHCGSHRGGRTQLPDTILEEDHLMTIPSNLVLIELLVPDKMVFM